MAERLVLAQLVIDEAGVVTGLAKVDESLKKTGQQSDQTGQKVTRLGGFLGQLEGNLFSLRKIANAVMGGFTVGAAIIGIKNLITEVAQADTGFALLQATAKGFYESIVGDGTKHVTIFHDVIVRLTQAVTILQIAFEELSNPQGPVGKALQLMLKFSVGGLVVQGMSLIAEQTEKIFGKLSEPGGPLERFAKRFDEIQAKAKAVAETVKAVKIAEKTGLESETVRGSEFNPFTAKRLTEGDAANTITVLPDPQVISNFRNAIQSVLGSLESLHERLTGVQFAAQATAEAFIQAGSAIGAALAGEAVSGAQVLKSILSSIAKQAAVEGLFELAKGFASLFSPGGQAAAASHFKSSALFFATAALAGGGARAIGGGASGAPGGGPSGSRGFGQEVGQQPRQERNELTVIIQGNVIGQEQYVRKLVVDVQNAMRAGAGGGRL
jgi:hypothetical protein